MAAEDRLYSLLRKIGYTPFCGRYVTCIAADDRLNSSLQKHKKKHRTLIQKREQHNTHKHINTQTLQKTTNSKNKKSHLRCRISVGAGTSQNLPLCKLNAPSVSLSLASYLSTLCTLRALPIPMASRVGGDLGYPAFKISVVSSFFYQTLNSVRVRRQYHWRAVYLV